MKKILLLFIGLTIISCSSGDDSSDEETIVIDQWAELLGAWKKTGEAWGSDPTNIEIATGIERIKTYFANGKEDTYTMTFHRVIDNTKQYYDIVKTGPNTYTSTYRGNGRVTDYRFKIEGNNLTVTEPYNDTNTFIEGGETIIAFFDRVVE